MTQSFVPESLTALWVSRKGDQRSPYRATEPFPPSLLAFMRSLVTADLHRIREALPFVSLAPVLRYFRTP